MKHHVLVRTALTLDDELDDITRARIWSRLEDQLDQPPAPRARWPIMLGVAAVAAIAVVVLVRLGGTDTDDHARILTVPAETTVSANLGPFTHASLVGPAALEIIGAPGAATTVRLRRGKLLAEFTGAPGRSLRVEAPGAVVEVVGTLFAVEARSPGACISVAHGRVRVTTADSVALVGAGERYCTHGPAKPQPIEEAVRDALEQHGSVVTAQPSPAAASSPDSSPRAPTTSPASPAPLASPPPPAPPQPAAHALATPPPVAITPRAPSPSPTAPSHAPATSAPAPSPSPTAALPPASSPSPAHTTSSRAPSSAPDTSSRSTARGPTPAESASSASPGDASPTVQAAAPPATADDLYRAAEASLAAGDLAGADRALDRLLVGFPASALVDQALYERARIAYQQRAWAVARRHLDRLAALPRTTLAEPGHYLACRIAVETRDGGAVTCLVAYRAAYPRSPHDLEALALVVTLTHASGGCATVMTAVAELARRHSKSRHAAAWRARCPERP